MLKFTLRAPLIKSLLEQFVQSKSFFWTTVNKQTSLMMSELCKQQAVELCGNLLTFVPEEDPVVDKLTFHQSCYRSRKVHREVPTTNIAGDKEKILTSQLCLGLNLFSLMQPMVLVADGISGESLPWNYKVLIVSDSERFWDSVSYDFIDVCYVRFLKKVPKCT